MKRHNFDVQQIFLEKKGLDLDSKKKTAGKQQPEKEVVKRPGFGKYDLDTGLTKEKKIEVRYSKELEIQRKAREGEVKDFKSFLDNQRNPHMQSM